MSTVNVVSKALYTPAKILFESPRIKVSSFVYTSAHKQYLADDGSIEKEYLATVNPTVKIEQENTVYNKETRVREIRKTYISLTPEEFEEMITEISSLIASKK